MLHKQVQTSYHLQRSTVSSLSFPSVRNEYTLTSDSHQVRSLPSDTKEPTHKHFKPYWNSVFLISWPEHSPVNSHTLSLPVGQFCVLSDSTCVEPFLNSTHCCRTTAPHNPQCRCDSATQLFLWSCCRVLSPVNIHTHTYTACLLPCAE